MAAIDKFYVSYFEDLDDLRKWAIIYFPKLLVWIDTNTTYESFYRDCKKKATYELELAKDYWHNISSDGTINSAVAYFIQDEDMNEEDAVNEASIAYDNAHKDFQIKFEETTIPVMNTPSWVDKKLKWICPLSTIREYLKNQCGVKEHWYYKLFWKGRKYFY